MPHSADEIVDIPPHRVKFFRTTGRMLLPCPATVAALVQAVPPGRVTTVALMRQALADAFGVEAVCPVTTQKALQAAARTAGTPYWRVVGAKGGLNARFPGGIDAHAAQLLGEDVPLAGTGTKRAVDNLAARLMRPSVA